MSDDQGSDASATEAPAETTTEQPKPTETVDFWKQKAREQEKRAKDNADAAKRLSEIEEAQKSEAEKAADAIASAKRDAEQARLEATRYRIASEFQLSTEDAEALEHAASEDGMRLIAGRLAAKSDERKKNGNVVPKEGTPTTPQGDEKRDFLRSIVGGD